MACISMLDASLPPREHHEHQHQGKKSVSSSLLIQQHSAASKHVAKLPPPPSPPKCAKTIATNWRQIHGVHDWQNHETLYPLLRDDLILYGQFVNACYSAFELDPNSKHYLNCKYIKSQIFPSSGLSNSGYAVTKYIYITAGINIPNQPHTGSWVGFVAISTDAMSCCLGRRDVLVSFRGTATIPEWTDLMSSLTPARLDPHNPRDNVRVESGFLNLYTSEDSSHGSCREQLLDELTHVIDIYKGEEMSITLTGHSMGSSLALLLGYDLTELALNRDGPNPVIPLIVYSFGGPRVGNAGFKKRCEELGVRVLRVVNASDPVTKVPGMLMNERLSFLTKYEMPWSNSCYSHVGVELSLDGVFKMGNPSYVHELETYLGLLKGAKKIRVGKRVVGLDVADRVRAKGGEADVCCVSMDGF